jgi:hypothetical protein
MLFLRFQAVNFVQRIQGERRHPSSILTILLTVKKGKVRYRTMYLAYLLLISKGIFKSKLVSMHFMEHFNPSEKGKGIPSGEGGLGSYFCP